MQVPGTLNFDPRDCKIFPLKRRFRYFLLPFKQICLYVYLAEYTRREKLSLQEDTSVFHNNGATFGFKISACMALGILTKTTDGQNNLIQIKQINIKCVKYVSFIICNLLIIFSQV